MTPKEVLCAWVKAWEEHDAHAVAALYHDDAVNHQVAAGEPMVGRAAILADTAEFFRAFPDSFTHIENLFSDGEWAMLEWSGGGTWKGEFLGRPPNGKSFRLRGCGFFHVVEGKIRFQRGYWDMATWAGQLGIDLKG
jgi:steroid delta-isomerase-like uncharacterized protein